MEQPAEGENCVEGTVQLEDQKIHRMGLESFGPAQGGQRGGEVGTGDLQIAFLKEESVAVWSSLEIERRLGLMLSE